MTLSIKDQQAVHLNYEAWVIHYMEEIGEMTTSDAQGILMIQENEDIMDAGFRNGITSEKIAHKILDNARA